MRAYVINVMVVLIIFPVTLQTVVNVMMLSTGGQGRKQRRHHSTLTMIKWTWTATSLGIRGQGGCMDGCHWSVLLIGSDDN